MVVDPIGRVHASGSRARYVGEPEPVRRVHADRLVQVPELHDRTVGKARGHGDGGGTGLPIAGARVTAGASETTTDDAGHYRFPTLPVGSYDMTASRYGYVTGSASGVAVEEGETADQDFALATAPVVL